MKPGERLFTVNEFSKAVGCKSSTGRAWILKRKVGYIKIGRLVRIPESEIERILSDGFVPPREDRNGRR